MKPPRSDAIFQIGDLLNNTYRIEAILGRGGTSEVYRARSEISGHKVALKALRSEFSGNDDFLFLMNREEAIREVRHDAIVRYFHNQRTDTGVVFLVMDHVDGVGLDRKMAEGGMSAEDLLTVAARVSEGLAAAHARNITHRDLSPDNIILRGGDPADAVIIDFGIAKDSNPGAETIVGNEFAGKYAYAAPEQLSGHADARSDIYALGALLLATFRGRAPDMGANPMEVITRKAQPLDTTGVPEPLKSLIDRATAPDPDDRPQTAEDLRAIALGGVPSNDDHATVIVPRPSGQHAGETVMPAAPVSKAPDPKAHAPKGRKGVLVIAALAVIVLGATGAWFGGLFPRGLPIADPFTLNVAQAAGASPVAQGFVPSQAVADSVTEQMSKGGGSAELTLARGDIGPDWGTGVASLIDLVMPLEEYRIALSGNAATVTGLTDNRTLHTTLTAALADAAIAPGLEISPLIELGPRFLPVDRVRALVAGLADCGELTLPGAPATDFGRDTGIAVLGRVAAPETRSALRDALIDIAGSRPVQVETEVLNPTLCTVDAALPDAPPAGFDIAFSQGDTGADNPSGRFLVGENPVIDVTIPAGVTDGFLLVSALDVSGNVFHLLPNLSRPDNSIATLRNGQTGPVTLRVAWPLADSVASEGEKIAFQVDDSALGKSRIMVIRMADDIFNGLRPTTESAESFAHALGERSGPVLSLDSRILVTAAP